MMLHDFQAAVIAFGNLPTLAHVIYCSLLAGVFLWGYLAGKAEGKLSLLPTISAANQTILLLSRERAVEAAQVSSGPVQEEPR